MKSLTKALGVALLALAAGVALAQTPAASTTGPTSRMDKLATLLDLTDSQKPQVQTILEGQRTQMQQLRSQMKAQWQAAKAAGTKPDFAQMRSAVQQLHQETLTKLSAVLSATQVTKFKTLESMTRHHHGWGHGGSGGGATASSSGS
ncbi:MAG: Spy/CpxP family protein refolding chaperone [Steroidobacteraceae bacterium]